MKKYSKTWRVVAAILLCLFMLVIVGSMFSGCGTRQGGKKASNETWVVIRLPDGNTIHTRVVDYDLELSGMIVVWTENREYTVGPNNICFIRDLE